MKESELAFWQKTARHYTRSMDRSAPLYAAVCERIRPHLSQDMNVLELACGTGAAVLFRSRPMSGSGRPRTPLPL